LRLYTRVRIIERMPSKPDTIESVFVDGPFTGENRIETAFRYARLQFGEPTPGVRIEVQTDIPRRASRSTGWAPRPKSRGIRTMPPRPFSAALRQAASATAA
jgi:hypothetical protein